MKFRAYYQIEPRKFIVVEVIEMFGGLAQIQINSEFRTVLADLITPLSNCSLVWACGKRRGLPKTDNKQEPHNP